MRNRLNSRTILSVKVFIIFVLGIVSFNKFAFSWDILLLIGFVWLILYLFNRYKLSQYVLVLAILLLGNILSQKLNVETVTPETSYIQGVIERDGTFNTKKNNAYIRVIYPSFLRGKRIKIINHNRFYSLFPGDEIAFKGFISRFNDRVERYYERRGVYGKITIGKRTYVKVSRCGNSSFVNQMFMTGDVFRKDVFSKLPGEYRNLVMSFLFGEREGLSSSTRNKFRKSGINHLLALSGLHIAVIMGVLFLIARLFRMKMKIVTIFVLFVIILYLSFVNFRVSAFRASVMVLFIMFSYMVKRYVTLYSLLFAVAFVILLYNPEQLFLPGFLLSFAATFAILISSELIVVSRKNIIRKYIVYPFTISILISLFTLPILLYFFSTVSIISPVANIIFIPLTTLIITLSILAMIFYIIFPIFSGYIIAVIYFTEKLFFLLLDYFNRFNLHINTNRNTAFILLIIPVTITIIALYRVTEWKKDVLSGI